MPTDESRTAEAEKRAGPLPSWTLVTSHGLTLLYVATHPDATVREIAAALELTERRVADIIRDLSTARLVLVKRHGRRNEYALDPHAMFRHPLLADIPFRHFVRLWLRQVKPQSKRSRVDADPSLGRAEGKQANRQDR